jgi:hypothetical protein
LASDYQQAFDSIDMLGQQILELRSTVESKSGLVSALRQVLQKSQHSRSTLVSAHKQKLATVELAHKQQFEIIDFAHKRQLAMMESAHKEQLLRRIKVSLGPLPPLV